MQAVNKYSYKLPALLIGLNLFCLLCCPVQLLAQASGPTMAFRAAANHYIAGQQQEALQAAERGLKQFPGDPKLQALAKKLQQQQQQKNKDQEQQKNQQQQQQQEQQSEASDEPGQVQQQQSDKKEQPSEEETQEAQQQRESAEGKEQQQQARDALSETEKRLQEMNISPEKAKMILEAMRSNEIQYLQQKQRQPARRSKSNKPDW